MSQKNEKLVGMLLGILILLLVIPLNTALSISPGRTTVEFEPGASQRVEVTLTNTDQEAKTIDLSVGGRLGPHVVLSSQNIQFSQGEIQKKFYYTIQLPSTLESGQHTADILAIVKPGEDSQVDGGAIASVGVITEYYVNALYNGKRLEGDIYAKNAEQGNTAELIVSAINNGKQTVSEAQADIVILDEKGAEVGRVTSDEKAIPSREIRELIARWPVEVAGGIYKAQVTLKYDGESITFEKNISIGNAQAIVIEVPGQSYTPGQIAELIVVAESKWNQPLKETFVTLQVFQGENLVGESLSSNKDLKAFGTEAYGLFLDTQGINEGEYNGRIILQYGEKSTVKDVRLLFTQNSIIVDGINLAPEKNKTLFGLYITIFVILIVIMIILYVIKSRKVDAHVYQTHQTLIRSHQ